jgi:hypothetical protein
MVKVRNRKNKTRGTPFFANRRLTPSLAGRIFT